MNKVLQSKLFRYSIPALLTSNEVMIFDWFDDLDKQKEYRILAKCIQIMYLLTLSCHITPRHLCVQIWHYSDDL